MVIGSSKYPRYITNLFRRPSALSCRAELPQTFVEWVLAPVRVSVVQNAADAAPPDASWKVPSETHVPSPRVIIHFRHRSIVILRE